jgi:hypothetical protein
MAERALDQRQVHPGAGMQRLLLDHRHQGVAGVVLAAFGDRCSAWRYTGSGHLSSARARLARQVRAQSAASASGRVQPHFKGAPPGLAQVTHCLL